MQRPNVFRFQSRPFIWSCLALVLGTLGLPAVAVWPPTIAEKTGIATAPPWLAMLPGAKPATVPEDKLARSASPAASARGLRCAECGVVATVREIRTGAQGAELGEPRTAARGAVPEAHAEDGRVFEITLRMSDGARHVFTDPSPGSWRPGDRLILIEGSDDGTP